METMTETDRPPLPERQSTDDGAPDDDEVVFDLEALTASYGEKTGAAQRHDEDPRNGVTALIGPSGCGKSTLSACLNRMNDLHRRGRVERQGQLPTATTSTARRSTSSRCGGGSAWCSRSPTRSRSRIYDNVAYGPADQRRHKRATWTTWSSRRCAVRRSGTR